MESIKHVKTASLVEMLVVDDRELNAYGREQLQKRFSKKQYKQIVDALNRRSTAELRKFTGIRREQQIHDLWLWLCSEERKEGKNYYGSGYLLTDLRKSSDAFLSKKAGDMAVMTCDVFIWKMMEHRYSSFYDNYSKRDDMHQAGMLGVLHALPKYDYSRGVDFATYAKPAIEYEMSRLARAESGIPERSHHYAMEQKKIIKAIDKLGLDNSPTPDNVRTISKESELSRKVVRQEMNAMIHQKTIAFDDASDQGYCMADSGLSVEEQAIINEEYNKVMKKLYEIGGKKGAYILWERLVYHTSWKKIANDLQSSPYLVKKEFNEVHDKLLKAVGEDAEEYAV